METAGLQTMKMLKSGTSNGGAQAPVVPVLGTAVAGMTGSKAVVTGKVTGKTGPPGIQTIKHVGKQRRYNRCLREREPSTLPLRLLVRQTSLMSPLIMREREPSIQLVRGTSGNGDYVGDYVITDQLCIKSCN